MGSVGGMLDKAREWLGMGEHPENSNRNVFTDWYGQGAMPWCDVFMSYVAAHSDNLDAVGGKFAWTPSHAEWFKNHGRWHYGLAGARPGDIVFFDWGGTKSINNIDHVGVVEAVRSDGTVVTIEGNTDNVVARRVRNNAVTVGWGRPFYTDAAAMPGDDGVLRSGSTGPLVRGLQTLLNAAGAHVDVDGDFGPATERALRAFQSAHPPLDVDGEFGPASAAALKAAASGHVVPIVPVPVVFRPPARLAVDGEFGPLTIKALQHFLNTHNGDHLGVDGVFGPASKRALQRFLAVTPDAIVGPNTVRALQRWVSARVDGAWGHDTTWHLQRRLAGISA